MNHTEGPWEKIPFDQGQTVIYQDRGVKRGPPIAIVFTGRDRPDGEGNADLIYAATDLLASTKLALDYFRSYGTQKFNPHDVEQSLEKAIAKAEGRTS